MGKKAKKILLLSAATLAGMYIYNRIVENASTKKNLLKKDQGETFEFKQGDIFYTKVGTGKPILLVHDINATSSGEEWSKINKKLAKDHTVYTIDLLGCGRSDKPAIHYTNYLYVQMITEFVEKVIKEKTDVIASNMSAAPVIMANNMKTDLFDQIVLINPIPIKKTQQVPDNILKAQQLLLQLPIIGTFAYNILHTPAKMDVIFKTRYFQKSQLVTSKIRDTFYEAAHLDNSNGKYLFASIIANYIHINIKHAVKRLDKTVYIIGTTNLKNNIDVMDEYHKLNDNFEITHISTGNLYPQIETPEKILSIIKNKLS